MSDSSIRRNKDDDSWWQWFIWNVICPLGALLILWPITWFVIGADRPFERSFHDGDLILFGSLLLISVSLQCSVSRSKILELGKLAALMLLIVFGAMKYEIISNGVSHRELGADKLFAYSVFGLSVALASVTVAYYGYWLMVRHGRDLGIPGEGEATK
jgi:hypothetical protein